MRRHHGRGILVRQEVPFFVLRCIADAERHHFAGGVQQGLRRSVGFAQNGFGGLPVGDRLFGGELVGIGLARGGIELVGDAARRVVHAIAQGQHREHHQRGDLYDIDGDVDRRRAIDSAVGDIGHYKRERDGDGHHEHGTRIGGAHEARPEGPRQVAAQDSHHRDHHSRIDPVVEVRGPADDELRKPGVAPRGVVIQERLFGEVIRTAGSGIQFRHLGVADGGGQAQYHGQGDSEPHCRPGHTHAGLHHESKPKEGAGRDERHRVHRQTGQAQGRFHCWFGVVCHSILLNRSWN